MSEVWPVYLMVAGLFAALGLVRVAGMLGMVIAIAEMLRMMML